MHYSLASTFAVHRILAEHQDVKAESLFANVATCRQPFETS